MNGLLLRRIGRNDRGEGAWAVQRLVMQDEHSIEACGDRREKKVSGNTFYLFAIKNAVNTSDDHHP